MTGRDAEGFRHCDTCGQRMAGPEWIEKHAEGVLQSEDDPRTARGRKNTLSQAMGVHKGIREAGTPLRDPCPKCVATYEAEIESVVKDWRLKLAAEVALQKKRLDDLG